VVAAHTSSACSSAAVAKIPSLAGESSNASARLCKPQGNKQRKPLLSRRESRHQLRLSRFRRQSVRTSRCVGDQKCSAGDSDGTSQEVVDTQAALTKPVDRQLVRTSRCVGEPECPTGVEDGTLTKPVDLEIHLGGTIAENVGDGTLQEAIDQQGIMTKPDKRQSARTSRCAGDQESSTGGEDGTLAKPADLKIDLGVPVAEIVRDIATGPTALDPVAPNICPSIAVGISFPSKRDECRAAASAARTLRRTPSACPRDTTPENIAKFFGCSRVVPFQQESSQAQSHDTCIGPSLDHMTVRERFVSAEQPPQYTGECVKHLPTVTRNQSQSSPHREHPVSADCKAASVKNIWQRDSTEFISRWSLSTPRSSSRPMVSETPKKRRRPLSFGGFCLPEKNDSAEVSTPLKSSSLMPIPPSLSAKRPRSNSHEDLGTNMAVLSLVVDLTQADPTGKDADSDDELPLASLIKKHDGMRSLRVLGRATTI